jgi:hypothetical protein
VDVLAALARLRRQDPEALATQVAANLDRYLGGGDRR